MHCKSLYYCLNQTCNLSRNMEQVNSNFSREGTTYEGIQTSDYKRKSKSDYMSKIPISKLSD